MLKRKPLDVKSDPVNILIKIKRKKKNIPRRLTQFKTIDHQFGFSENLKLLHPIRKREPHKDTPMSQKIESCK